MKKYSIAFVVNKFPSVSETFIQNQITDLIERAHEIKIFAFTPQKLNFTNDAVTQFGLIERTTYFQPSLGSMAKTLMWIFNFVTHNFKCLFRSYSWQIFKPWVLRKAIRLHLRSVALEKFLNSNKFDIVHAHFGQRGAVVADLIARKRVHQFKFVTSFHGYDLNPLFVSRYKVAYKELFQYADAVTVNSKYLEGILLEVYAEPKKLCLLPESLKTEQYKNSHAPCDKLGGFTICFCGRLVEFKAPDLAVMIMDELVNRRGYYYLKLDMIGDGKLRKGVEILVARLGLGDHVRLLGALSQEMVVGQMRNADLFLLPGIHEKETGRAETQGLVIQEAQSMELPVVVSDAGGMKYGLVDGVTGYVVKAGDVRTFADKIELLINDSALRYKMGKEGREWVKLNFDTRILGDKLLTLYSTL